MRRSVLALGLLCGLFGLSACASKKPADVTLSTFGDVDSINQYRTQLALFQKDTGITTDQAYIPWGSYADKLISQLSAGTAPDIIWLEVGFMVPLQHAHALLPLDDFIKRDKVDLKAYYPQVMSRFSKGGHIYALPQDTAPIACLYYNRKLFREAGLAMPTDRWTWNDMLAAAKKLTAKGPDGHTKVWGYKDNYNPDWANMIYSNGGLLVDDWRNPTRCVMDSPQDIEAIRFLHDLMHVHRVMPTDAARESLGGTGRDMFIDGHLAMFRSGYWVTTILRQHKDLDWDMVAAPTGPQAQGKHLWATGGSGWAMSTSARDKEKTWKVIRFLASAQMQTVWSNTGGAQPSLIKLAHSPVFTAGEPPKNKGFLVEAPYSSIYTADNPKWDEAAASIIQPKMDLILLDQLDVAQGMKEITAAVDKFMFNR